MVKVAVVAFVVLQLKEWYDAGRFDTLGTGVDAVLIAAGTFVLSALGVGKHRP
jgi:transketolase C-terminal domain/subunit